ncbi:hypothetical protein HUO14_02600 [Parasphingorhabdus flavimaris]|uniref:Uncharacterized protein n=1 Tax=Parasphingorhabdus flavimaris TaxID=266812 RepID=A0ABX2MZE8_9SPHN|nr:hypothetical protein [Parasphingorhabdus flavimaris]NVD26794.1 hypothetical protein [Parasphingorhabdus flavimaris]
MSSRNGSYASKVDKMPRAKLTTPIERAKAGNSTPKSISVKAAPSPTSARPAFEGNKAKSLAQKARNAKQQFQPSPARAPQPRGMGENSVNWQAHISRANAMREQVEGPKRQAVKPPKDLASKAKKAAREYRAASPDLDKGQSPSR